MMNKSAIDTKEGKEWLRGLLRSEIVTVIFVKKDGSERKMVCTLSENKIPVEKAPKGTEKVKNDEVVPVFDIENQGWRSFRWDSITGIHFDLHK